MADDEQGMSGMVPGMVQEFVAQLRAASGRLEGLAGFGGHRAPATGGLPLPGALSAAQMASITDSIAAQRRSIEALKSRAVVVRGAARGDGAAPGPLAEWSRTWADLEGRLLNMGRGPPAAG